MIILRYVFAFMLFLSCLHVHAQQKEAEKTLLWKISGKGISQPSYLYGTIHLMCPEEIKVSDSLRAKFYSTQKLFLEIDIDDPSVMLKTMQQMKMKNDTTLNQLLTQPQYDSLSTSFKKVTGMSLTMMNTMKPELVETMIYPALLGCEGAQAWEQKFTQLAKANNMNVYGLENVEDQLKIFDEIPYKVQANELVDALQNIDSTKRSFNQMLTLYKQKDLSALATMLNEDSTLSDYDDLLLNNRNRKWVPEIIEQAKLQPTFFAVGAGHLGNVNGLIALLRKQGLTVSPVYY